MNLSSYYERIDLLKKWKNSENHKYLVAQQQGECDRLIEIGLYYLQNLKQIHEDAMAQAKIIQYAIKGSTHRGIYCPSPVIDLFIGNISRGKQLKRLTARSKPSHCFGLDVNGQLVFVKTYLDPNAPPSYTEYLIYEPNKIIGIAVDDDKHLFTVSKEIYLGNVLQSYTYMQQTYLHNGVFPFDLYSEEYSYDSLGLATCVCTSYDPIGKSLVQKSLCTFQRKDGLLHSYTVTDQIWEQIDPKYAQSIEYISRLPRKA